MIVVLGGNRFVDCQSILGFQGQGLLNVSLQPIRVQIMTPSNSPSVRQIRVDDAATFPQEHVRVVSSERSFAIFWDTEALALANLIEPETVHLKVDLRSIGMNIHDDVEGLHIGTNVFTGNELKDFGIAINLG